MGNVFFFDWEVRLIEAFQSVSGNFLTSAAVFFTMLGEEYLIIVVLGLIYWCVDKELGRKVALALSGTMILGTLIKGLTLRRRPYMDNAKVKCIRAAYPENDIMSPVAQGFSTPSLHASMSVAVYGTLAYRIKKLLFIIMGVILPLFIGLSRVYLGVHYPTDVMLGWVLGIIVVFVIGAAEKRFGYKIAFTGILVIGSAGFFYCRDIEFWSSWGLTLGFLLGFIYEEKRVGFEPAKRWWSYILRPALGVVFFALVSAVLKIPAKAISTEWLSLIYRLIRYAVSTFIIIGLYPHLFKKFKI